ncbi:ferritin-like-domain-containing protein [Glomus cerebriforme]|uniref:Ferritin-like-domain-containing protein n=1 Tax=Glomus cerebriforme TaxID=658196 RepID=A0A397RYP0_9GLOM|nr:ferritin-like-domain-containing protein [Glomus cerebriforme]
MANIFMKIRGFCKVGRQPVFYSPETMPFYPNPLLHFEQGRLLVHLSKADVKTLDNFIDIEKPETEFIPLNMVQSSMVVMSIVSSENKSNKSEPKPSVKDINLESIASLYKKIRGSFQKLDGEIEYQTNFQLEPDMGYAPSTGADNEKGLIVIKDLTSAEAAIDLIIQQFNGEPRVTITKGINLGINGKIRGTINNETKTIIGTIEKGTIKGNITLTGNVIISGTIEGIFKGNKDNKTVEQIIKGDFVCDNVFGEDKKKGLFNHNNNTNEVFVSIEIGTSLNGKINGKINNVTLEENSHYNTFRMCKMYIENASESEYQLWPVIKDPNVSSYTDPNRFYTDPNIITTATAFNAAYSYLMLLLQSAWRVDGQKKKTLVIGGMPALMHGVLKPIAMFLAETPVSTDTNAGATFGYYEFTRESNPKQQLQAAVKKASEAFPYSDKLKDAGNGNH